MGASSSARFLDQRGQRGRERRIEREPRRGAAATGAAHEQQRPSRADPVGGVPSDLERQQEMGLDVARAASTSNSASGA